MWCLRIVLPMPTGIESGRSHRLAREIVLMNIYFIEKEITYDGSQLASHWIYTATGLKGDAITSFIGPAIVDLAHMVDLEDVVQKKPIYSQKMLHFIVEHFDDNLEKMVLKQRLFVSILAEILNSLPISRIVVRKGDDLFIDHYKLSVSIATRSNVSTLMHTGINVSSLETPVPTLGLDDLKINAVELAGVVMKRYAKELEEIQWARCKVRSVS